MDYVRVINPGLTYTNLSSTHDEGFWGAHITNNVLTNMGETYRVIKEMDHPSWAGTRIMTILDDNWAAFIIGVDGVVESTSEAFHAGSREQEAIPVQPRAVVAEEDDRTYKVGDIIIITSPDNTHYGKRLRVTDPHYSGYDVVTGRDENSKDRAYGFKFSEFERYHPEPELLPDDKPKFSKNELLEVLKQDKTPEEMILDLIDHITN